MTTANVLGVFAHVDTTVQAIRDLRAKGFSELTVYTPVPVSAPTTGFFLTIWSSLKWELVTGGKAPVSIPPFVIIAFELTILLGGLATALAILILGHLPKLTPSPTYDPRFSVDRFGVAVACPPDKVESVQSVLSAAGAEEVRQSRAEEVRR